MVESLIEIAVGAGLFLLIVFLAKFAKQLKDLNKNLSQKVKYNVTPYEGTTQVLASIGASTCIHDWDLVRDTVMETPTEKKAIIFMRCNKCGTLDKTIESVTHKEPPPPKSECRHKWQDQKKVEIDSAFEQLAKGMPMEEIAHSYSRTRRGVPDHLIIHSPWFFRKNYVRTRICKECGEIHTIEAANYEFDDMPDDVWDNANQPLGKKKKKNGEG